MLGRRDEVKALLAAVKSCQSRLIIGPAGIGKRDFLRNASLDRSNAWCAWNSLLFCITCWCA
jgi:hypothetical protein